MLLVLRQLIWHETLSLETTKLGVIKLGFGEVTAPIVFDLVIQSPPDITDVVKMTGSSWRYTKAKATTTATATLNLPVFDLTTLTCDW